MRRPNFALWCTMFGLGGFLYAAWGTRIGFTHGAVAESSLSLLGATGILAFVGACVAVLVWAGLSAMGGESLTPSPALPQASNGPWPALQPSEAKTTVYRRQRPQTAIVAPSELYGLRLFQLVELARDLGQEIAVTSDSVLASMFSHRNAPRDLAPDMLRLQAMTANLETLLAEIRARTDAWVKAHVELR